MEADQAIVEAQTEAITEVADSNVEIAQIQADRDVTIAAIGAEVEANRETWTDQRLSEMEGRLTSISDQVATLTELVATQSSPISDAATQTTITETSIPADTLEEISETAMEVTGSSEGVSPEAAIVEEQPAERHRHLRLV